MNNYVNNVLQFEQAFDCKIKIETQIANDISEKIITIFVISKRLFNIKYLSKDFQRMFLLSLVYYNIIDINQKDIIIDFIEMDKILIFLENN